MIEIELFNFGKEENSTERPAGAGLSFEISLKNNCSIMNPVVSIKFSNDNFCPYHLNYAHIARFGRYYFVRNWTWSNGIWWAELFVDVLATWANEIVNSEQYVTRAEADYDGEITDTVYPVIGTPEYARVDITSPFKSTFSDGRYIIGIINPDASGVGAVSYYVMDSTEMNSLKTFLLGNADYLQITDESWIDENVLKSVFNPFQYIASCIWVPYIPTMSAETVTGLKFGWWTATGVSAHRLLNNSAQYRLLEFSIPRHPQAEERGEYLNRSPYTMYTLTVPGFGVIPIDSTWIEKESTFRVNIQLDPVTGTAILRIYAINPVGSAAVVYETMTQIGVNIQLAQITNNVIGAAHSVIDSASNIAKSISKLDVAGSITSAASGALSTFECLVPSVSMTNINGTIAPFAHVPSLSATFYRISEEDIHHNGRPLMQIRNLYELPGYIKVFNPHIEWEGITKDEQTELINIMAKGFVNAGVG